MRVADDMGLSPQQREALLDRHSEVLVAAGAGSGKTRLLVAAVVQALVEEDLPLEKLVAVTFTRKAGAELASRVRAALEGCGRVDLARALDTAALGTIDSLCRRLLKDQAMVAGVDPGCGVLEAEAAGLVKREIVAKAWEKVVERADERLLEVLASHSGDLRPEVVSLYDRLRGLDRDAPRLIVESQLSEEETRTELVTKVRDALAAGAAQERPTVSLTKEIGKLEACLDWLEGPTAGRQGELGLRRSESFFPRRGVRNLEEHFLPVREALSRYRCALAQARLRPLVEAADLLLVEFHAAYTQWKEEHGLVDFADLELKTRRLVARRDQGEVDPALMDGSFLLVDEFQDTNELQWSILSRLGAERTLLVGDERQSIYRFRGADVQVFRRRRDSLADDGQKCGGGGLHRLDVNYRSRSGLLDFINRLFAHPDFFGAEFARLTPGVSDENRPTGMASSAAGDARRPPVCARVLVAERREDEDREGRPVSAAQAEAEVLAAELRRMVDEDGRRQRDLVVLLPTQTQVERYRDALVDQGLDVYVVRGRGYYGQEEITDVTSLLRVLVNPHDDLALLTVLRSPLVSVSDDGLYLLGRERRAKRAGSLWEVVRGGDIPDIASEDRVALGRVRDRLAEFRPRVGRAGLARLIDELSSSFSYDLCLLAAPEGRRRFANVRKLMRLAEEYETAEGPDVAGFLGVLRTMGEVSDREGSAPTLAEGEDVVRVMTIHQAKGLEFPVVALAGLSADAHKPRTPLFAVGVDAKVGVFLKGHRQRNYESYEPSWGPAAEIMAEETAREREEDVRLLYVAMTRAEEHLLLVGAKPGNEAMDNTRIGRILAALGLTAFPTAGEEVPLEGLAAVAVGAASEIAGGRGGPPRTGRTERELPRESIECPRLLESPASMALPTRMSFSALAAYQSCARRFYLERVLGLDLEGVATSDVDDVGAGNGMGVLDQEEASAGLDVGIIVHHLLERLAVQTTSPAADGVKALAEESARRLGMRLSSSSMERAVQLTLAVWDSPVAERLSSPSTVREAPFFFALDGIVVSGVMDLVCRDPECWVVVDYKTNALKGRPLDKVAKQYLLQSQLYGLAALRAGAPEVRMELLFLERPGEPLSVLYGARQVGELEGALREAISGLRRREFPRSSGPACQACAVGALCDSMARV